MKQKVIKRLGAAAVVVALAAGSVMLPASSAQADSGWPTAKVKTTGK